MRLLVIGGSDAGISAGLRARELDPTVEVSLLVADAYPNFSICGLPYYLSGDVADWRSLAHRTSADLAAAGLRLLLDHTAQAIDPSGKQVTVSDLPALTASSAMTGSSSPLGRFRSARRSTGWTCPACICCTPWATPSPSRRH
jgi:NADPH-dependent 2,4-dienoyl-CoA reductase/sulfur reductase-like enzyme